MNTEELKAELANAVAALDLIEFLARQNDVHLGRPRYSGIAEGCIACIAALGKSRDAWHNTIADHFHGELERRQSELEARRAESTQDGERK